MFLLQYAQEKVYSYSIKRQHITAKFLSDFWNVVYRALCLQIFQTSNASDIRVQHSVCNVYVGAFIW